MYLSLNGGRFGGFGSGSGGSSGQNGGAEKTMSVGDGVNGGRDLNGFNGCGFADGFGDLVGHRGAVNLK